MAKQVTIRRGTNSEQATFVGAEGEITYNTTQKRLAAHDGAKIGGFKVVHENGDNGLDLTLTGNANLTAKNVSLKDSTLGSNVLIGSSGIRFIENGQLRYLLDGSNNYIWDSIGSIALSVNDRQAYDSNNDSVINWENKSLIRYDGTRTSVDWNAMGLYDNLVYPSVDWDNRQLYDAGGTVITLDWNNNTLWRNVGDTQRLSIDWSGQKMYDQAGILSQNWNNRQLVKSDGSTVIINWEYGEINDLSNQLAIYLDSRSLYNSSTEEVINWEGSVLKYNDTINGKTLDWANRHLYRQGYNGFVASPELSLDWQNFTLNSGSTINLNWNTKTLSGNWTAQYLTVTNNINGSVINQTNGDPSLNLETKILYDSDAFNISLDWNNRQLINNGDLLTLDWQNRILSGTWNAQNIIVPKSIDTSLKSLYYTSTSLQSSIDWGIGLAYDGNNYQSIDWNSQRILFDNNLGTVSLNWANRKLLDSDGVTVSLDWSGHTLSGNWTSEKLIANTGILNNKIGIGFTNPTYSLDVKGTGAFQSVIITGFSTAPATSTSPGIKGQIATSGAFLFVATGNNLWGRTTLVNW